VRQWPTDRTTCCECNARIACIALTRRFICVARRLWFEPRRACCYAAHNHATIQHATCSVCLQVALEMRSNHAVPVDVHNGFSVEFVWKSISFDRMQASALPQQRQHTYMQTMCRARIKEPVRTMPQDGS
jgi:hypothetical protein